MFEEITVTIPGWLTATIIFIFWVVTIIWISRQPQMYPVLLMDLPFVGEEDDRDE